MKKIIVFGFLAMVFWTCSTEMDILDNWKETSIVYGLLDQTSPKQYIRIQKAFLGPDNALAMAQVFDSINYTHALNVKLQDYDAGGNLQFEYPLQPDTNYNKDPGVFAGPEQIIYSMNTPMSMPTDHKYKLVIDNSQTGNHVESSTTLVQNFNVTRPLGPSVNFVKINSTTQFDVEWQGVSNARIYQVGLKFHYREVHVSGPTDTLVTPEWNMGSVETTSSNETNVQSIEVDPNSFYRFLQTCIFDDANVTARYPDYVEITVYAGGEELDTYMNLNGPSTSLVQERPFYTNIQNGYGVFSSRVAKTKTNLTLTPLTMDTLSRGQYSCYMRFGDRNNVVWGCQ